MEHPCGAHLPPSSLVVFVWACLHKQCNGWATAARLPPQARNSGVPGSYLWCDHPGGHPCPAGAIYCLIYLLRLLPPSSHLLQAPGVYRGIKGCCVVHRPLPTPVLGVDPQPTCLGGRNCTVANLRGVRDPATLGTLCWGWVGFKLLILYSLLAGSESWGGGQSLKPLFILAAVFL